MRIIRFALAALLLPLVIGCASVTGSREQQTQISTTCNGVQISGATCTVVNDKGSWTTNTPGSVNLTKSYEDISVRCTFADSQGAAVMSSKSNGGVWGNILIGGGIGYLVDRSTGAGFNYPTSINVPLGEGCQRSKPNLPAASSSKPDVEERLKNLQNLYDRGLISTNELASRRKKILEDM